MGTLLTVTFLAPSPQFSTTVHNLGGTDPYLTPSTMSILGPDLDRFVLSVQQMRWVSLSTLAVLLWDHSKCPCFPWSARGHALTSKQLTLVICLDKEVRLASILMHSICVHIVSLLD